MKVSFKDVGQGDSIILEWEEKGISKIGIIDCKLKGKSNPVLEYVRENEYKEIVFIILSHPHEDHYSGLPSLLDYVESNSIKIHKIYHTLESHYKEYWRYFEIGTKSTNQLQYIIQKWALLKKSGLIRNMYLAAEGVEFPVNEKIKIKFLAPSHADKEHFNRIVQSMPARESARYKREASKAANFLSTVFKLSIDTTHLLFTADAEQITFLQIIDRESLLFHENQFSICQVPHHGSEKNHCNDFWNHIETLDIKYAVISAGKHQKYNHPSFNVVKNFYDRGYSIRCTNFINGMKQFIEKINEIAIKSAVLDTGSVLAEEYAVSEDQVFVWKEGFFNPELKR